MFRRSLNFCQRSFSTESAALPNMPNLAKVHSESSKLRCFVWGSGRLGPRLLVPIKHYLPFVPLGKKYEKIDPSNPYLGESLTPREIPCPDESGFRQISFGIHHGAILTRKGALYTFGDGEHYELGHGDDAFVPEPKKVNVSEKFVKVACGHYHTLALTDRGELWAWGGRKKNFSNPVISDFGPSIVARGSDINGLMYPDRIRLPGKVIDIAAGELHSVALCEGGFVFTWGLPDHGALGFAGIEGVPHESPENLNSAFTEAQVKGTVTRVVARQNNTGILTDIGELFIWGRNDYRQIGNGEGTSGEIKPHEDTPQAIKLSSSLEEPIVPVYDFSLGYTHSSALDYKRRLYFWGNRLYGVPTHLQGSKQSSIENVWFEHVSAGDRYTLAADVYGHLYSWGDANSQCLGHSFNSGDYPTAPQRISGFGPEQTPGSIYGQVVNVFAGANRAAALVSPAPETATSAEAQKQKTS